MRGSDTPEYTIINANSRVDLVFTDVAGEKFEAALLGGAEDPVVLGALRSAQTFVYLFDFISWKTFAATLNSELLSGNWSEFVNQRKKLNEDSRAVRDSFEMLKAVVDKIYQIRKKEGDSNPYKSANESTFVLAFPKADLYWSTDKFLSDFLQDLKDKNIVIPSLSSGVGSYVTRGISEEIAKDFSSQSDNSKITDELKPEDVLKIARIISDYAKNSINTNFQKTFQISKDETQYAEMLSLPSAIA